MVAYGVNVSDIRDLAETAIPGKKVSQILDGKKRFDLRVRFPEGGGIKPTAIPDS